MVQEGPIGEVDCRACPHKSRHNRQRGRCRRRQAVTLPSLPSSVSSASFAPALAARAHAGFGVRVLGAGPWAAPAGLYLARGRAAVVVDVVAVVALLDQVSRVVQRHAERLRPPLDAVPPPGPEPPLPARTPSAHRDVVLFLVLSD
eukprot:1195915-Rhodomonas_salina.4